MSCRNEPLVRISQCAESPFTGIPNESAGNDRDGRSTSLAGRRGRTGRGASAPARHLARGKLLPRARVELLLDPGSPFLEFSQLVAYGLNDDEATAHLWDDGVIDPKDTHTSLGLGLAASLSAPIPAIRFSVFRM
jgi:acetyl-CoA carboxylase carboxyltransferase component